MALLSFYKNAGYIYNTIDRSNAHHFVGSLAIEYDQWVYIGHMESFSWGYDEIENQNGKITFEIEFKISRMYDNHLPVETVKPLRAITESLSDPRFTVGGTVSTYEADTLPSGSMTGPGEDVLSSEGIPAEGEASVAGNGGTDLAVNDGGFESATQDENFRSFCVLDPNTDEIVCYNTIAEAESALSSFQGEFDFPFCVVDPATGELVGCFATLAEANEALQSVQV